METNIPEPRRPLTRQRVLEMALDLIDRQGLEALSMRKLAAELGVEAMSLYKHVANKDDLLAGVGELVWGKVAATTPPTDDWAAWLRALAAAIRGTVHRHPRALPVLVGLPVTPVPMLVVFADQLERHPRRGRRPHDPVSTLCTVTAFALGCAVAELSCLGQTPDHPETEWQRMRRITRALPPDVPDRLIDTALTVCTCDADEMFTGGLELIIRGCGLGPAPKPPATRARGRRSR